MSVVRLLHPLWSLVLPWTLLAVVLQGLGAFAAFDTALYRRSLGLRSLDRAQLPLLLVVDEAAEQRWGPLPWPGTTWAEVADTLDRAGLGEVQVLAEPERLMRGAPSGDPAGSARLVVPQGLGDPSRALASPFVRGALHLDPGAIATGSLRPPARQPSALCVWGGRCPQPHASPASDPIRRPRRGDLPSLSLVALAEGTRLDADDQRLVLLGVTVPDLARPVTLFDSTTSVPHAEALALAVATLRSTRPTPMAPLPLQALWLGLTCLLATALLHLEPVPWWVRFVVPPVFAIQLVAIALGGGLYLLPVVATLMVTLGPAVQLASRTHANTLENVEGLAFALARDAARFDWQGPDLDRPTGVLAALADLSRNQLFVESMGYLQAAPLHARWVGGHGVGPRDLVRTRWPAWHPLLRAARRAPGGIDASALLRDGRKAWLVAVGARRHRPQGYWLLVWALDRPAPQLGHLEGVNTWLARQFATTGPRHGEGLATSLERRLQEVGQRARSASRQRQRQASLLHALDVPLLTADRSGTIVFANPALVHALGRADVPVPRSIRHLLALTGASDVADTMRTLVVAHAPVRRPLEGGPTPRTLLIHPVLQDEQLIGFIGRCEDPTPVPAPHAGDGVQGGGAFQARDRIMTLDAQLHLASSSRDLPAALHQARADLRALEVGLLGTPTTDLAEAIARVSDRVGDRARQRIDLRFPPFPLPVVGLSGDVVDALEGVLRHALRVGPPGAHIAVDLQEGLDHSVLQLAWRDPAGDDGSVPTADRPWREALAGLGPVEVEQLEPLQVRVRVQLERGPM